MSRNKKPTDTVSRAPRTNPAARASYKNPHSIEIPPEVEKAFRNQGYKLRWVRIVDMKSKQYTNERVNYFLTVGGSIVTPQEVKDLDATFLTGLTKYDFREDFADDDDRAKGQMSGIKKDDLLLMKLPLEYIEDKARQNAEMVEELLTSAQHDYKRQGGSDVFIEKFKHGSTRVQVNEGFFE